MGEFHDGSAYLIGRTAECCTFGEGVSESNGREANPPDARSLVPSQFRALGNLPPYLCDVPPRELLV